MEILIENAVQQLKEDPISLNSVTERVLKEAAKEHHPHNRLLPASFVQLLLAMIAPENILGNNEEGQRYLLAASCLRGVLIANFPQLEENKVFRAITMNYAQTLNLIASHVREEEGDGNRMKFAARGYILSEIMLKLVQISHVFVPELLRFAKMTLQIALEHLHRCSEQQQGQGDLKQLKIASKLAQKSKIPKHIYKLTCRKVWKKSSYIVFIKFLFEQVKTFLTTCGFSKHALSLQIYKQISELFSQYKSQLSSQELAFLSLEQGTVVESKQASTEEIFLEQPLKVRQLTPRFYDEEQSAILSKLRKKKHKLTKKIETQLRKGVIVKQQEAQVREQVRREKGQRQQKKEQLIIEKQTVQVKKYNRQIKKVKQARKGSKNAGKAAGGKAGPKGK